MRGLARRWWAAHVAPPPPRGFDNLRFDGARWRPAARALVTGPLALLAAAAAALLLPPTLAANVALTAGFVHVSHGVSARAHPLRGRHGGFRDLVVVNLAAPLVTGFWPGAGGAVAALAGFYGGLHLSLATLAAPPGVSLSARHLRRASPPARALIAALGLAALALAGLGLWRMPPRAALLYALGLAAVPLAGNALRPEFHCHLHHWMLGLLLLPAAAALGPACAGGCVGMFVEGVARWSAAPLWHGSWPSS